MRSSSARSAARPPGQPSCGGGSSAEAAGAGGASIGAELDIMLAETEPALIAEAGVTCKQRAGPPVATGRRPAYATAGWTRQPHSPPPNTRPSVTFEDGMTLDCGARLRRMTVAYRTYGTLNAARSNAVLVCHALTGDQYVAETPSGHRQGRLVGRGGRPRPADRHRPLLRHLRQRAGRLHGLHRPAQPARRRHRPVGHRFPAGDHPRHGPRAEDADRPPGHRAAVRGAGRLDGRDAGAAMGGELSRTRCSPRCRSPAPPITRRRTSRSTRSGGRRSSPIRTGRAGATGRAGGCRRAAWRWRGCARTSPICRRRR